MAKHNLTQAAKLAGISRSTIMRHISDGKISKEIGKDGKPCVDTAEIERVYGVTQQHRDTKTVSLDSLKTPQKTQKDSALWDKVQELRQQKLEALEDQLKSMQEERDSWKQEAEDWKRQAQSLLTDQRPQSEPPVEGAQKPVEGPQYQIGWWDRFLGRKALREA